MRAAKIAASQYSSRKIGNSMRMPNGTRNASSLSTE